MDKLELEQFNEELNLLRKVCSDLKEFANGHSDFTYQNNHEADQFNNWVEFNENKLRNHLENKKEAYGEACDKEVSEVCDEEVCEK